MSVSAQVAQYKITRPMPPVVHVHVGQTPTGDTIAPELFGGFIEPTRQSFNNGLMAQILVNPSLESGLWDHENEVRLFAAEPELAQLGYVRALPLPWLPWNAAANNRYELRVGDAANSYQSLALFGLPAEAVGIQQPIYLPVHRTLRYVATAYARALEGRGTLNFAIRNASGVTVARSAVSAAKGSWTKLSATLNVPQGAIAPREKAAFGIFLSDGSRIEVDQITLTPADAVDGFDPDVLAMADSMGMTELRLGGNFSSYYHWRDGIGDPDKRRTIINIAWGIPEYNNFGTDEFLDLCRRLHVRPQFDLNLGTGTVAEAQAWAEYIRTHYKDPVIWELGNELWGPWQVAPPTLSQFPARTLAFSQAIHRTSPGDVFIATGSNTTQYTDWTTAALTLPRGTFDLLSLHFIETGGRDTIWKPRDPASTLMMYAKSFHVGQAFPPMQAEVEASAHRGHVHFAMTEWLFNSMAEGEGNNTNDFPAWNNLGGAVAAGGFFNTLFRHTAEIRLADMTGMIEYAGIAKERERVYAQPSYYVFQMYSAVKGEGTLPTSTDSGTYAIVDPRYLFPAGGDVPFVDSVATRRRDGTSVTVFLVNRGLSAADVQLDVEGAQHGLATVVQISGATTFDQNTEENPHAITPVTKTQDAASVLSLPAQSVTRVTLKLSGK